MQRANSDVGMVWNILSRAHFAINSPAERLPRVCGCMRAHMFICMLVRLCSVYANLRVKNKVKDENP